MAATVSVHETGDAIGIAVANILSSDSSSSIAARHVFTMAISGGSQASLLSSRLVEMAEKNQVDFSKWHIFLVDERCVPYDHPDSNYALLKAHILDKIPAILPNQVHTLDLAALAKSTDAAAEAYERDLHATFASFDHPPNGIPRLDVVLLGMGPDGHTASLFPAHALLREHRRLVAPIDDSPKPPAARITLTLPMLAAARRVVFLVSGREKAPAVATALHQPLAPLNPLDSESSESVDGPELELPARLVTRLGAHVEWHLDAAAAAALPR